MTDILAYLPTYSPYTESSGISRPYTRLLDDEIGKRLKRTNRSKPGVYMDAIDSVLNNPTPVRLVVADGRSTESIRIDLVKHQRASGNAYTLELYDERLSQWKIFNDIIQKHATPETEYFVYTSSDIVWRMDWVAEAIKAFDSDPTLQILFPCVSRGDGNLPCQVAAGPRDLNPFEPPFQRAARAQVLNMYAAVFRMDFLRTYGGYMTAFANCFSESFLQYQCEALGGRIAVLPRGWVYHHSAVDAHGSGNDWYNYGKELPLFHPLMDEVLEARARGEMSVDFLKGVLKCGNRYNARD